MVKFIGGLRVPWKNQSNSSESRESTHNARSIDPPRVQDVARASYAYPELIILQ